jgi:hypothetical protein
MLHFDIRGKGDVFQDNCETAVKETQVIQKLRHEKNKGAVTSG